MIRSLVRAMNPITTKPFHVYAEDGFEGAYASERTARSHARRGSERRNRIFYRVVKVGSSGYTGGGSGRVVAEYLGGREI